MLAEKDSTELSGWLAYLRLSDEFADYHLARAMASVFATPRKGRKGQFGGSMGEDVLQEMDMWDEEDEEEEEEVIDTTDPAFVREFKGFIGK